MASPKSSTTTHTQPQLQAFQERLLRLVPACKLEFIPPDIGPSRRIFAEHLLIEFRVGEHYPFWIMSESDDTLEYYPDPVSAARRVALLLETKLDPNRVLGVRASELRSKMTPKQVDRFFLLASDPDEHQSGANEPGELRTVRQSDIAKRVGTSQGDISKIERGLKPIKVVTLKRYLIACGYELEIKAVRTLPGGRRERHAISAETNLEVLRDRFGPLTQKRLGERLGVQQSAVSKTQSNWSEDFDSLTVDKIRDYLSALGLGIEVHARSQGRKITLLDQHLAPDQEN